MNVPGQAGGNWRWRLTDSVLSPAAFDWLRKLTKESNRFSVDAATVETAALEANGITPVALI